MHKTVFMWAAIPVVIGVSLRASRGGELDLKELARQALSENTTESAAAIATLRAKGPAGLQILTETYAAELKRGPVYSPPPNVPNANPAIRTTATNRETNTPRTVIASGPGLVFPVAQRSMTPEWQRLVAALDAVGQQRDNWASRLYWHTDFEQAKATAKATGKPILSLRMLGKLNEEFSCANSRFFRSALYPDATISKALRERFILHWQSVRPVPKVTIDFGDGRKIETTITGNSIHYVLDAEGRPLDALPGMNSPKAFINWLERSERLAKEWSTQTGEEREGLLRNYHQDRLDAVTKAWADDFNKIGGSSSPQQLVALLIASGKAVAEPTAAEASQTTGAKKRAQIAVVNQVSPALAISRSTLTGAMTDATWGKIAQLHLADAKLDSDSIKVIQTKEPGAWDAGRLAVSKSIAESPTMRAINNFQRSIAEDTVRNEYLFHSTIHEWFIEGKPTRNVEQLNRYVYAQLFLTPDSDPWLGLLPRGAYTGLPVDGVVFTSAVQTSPHR